MKLSRLLKNGVFPSLCAAHGRAAIFDDYKSLKMKQAGNRIFGEAR